jgi:putative oxidoreductase
MNRQDIAPAIGLLIARAGFGGYMMTHGWGKLQMLRARDFESFGDAIGLGAPLSLTLVTFAEFGCALLVILGLATRLATIPIITAMAVAAFVAHASDPWTMGEAYRLFMAGETQFPVSKQPALMYLIAFAALLATGPGKLSLDAVVWGRLRGRRERAAAAE